MPQAELSSTRYPIASLSPSSCPGSLLMGWGSPEVLGSPRALVVGAEGASEVEAARRQEKPLQPGPSPRRKKLGRQEGVAILQETWPDVLPAP